jgi:hypothetical protein
MKTIILKLLRSKVGSEILRFILCAFMQHLKKRLLETCRKNGQLSFAGEIVDELLTIEEARIKSGTTTFKL